MQHYQSSPSSHLVATSLDGSNTYPRDLKSHTRNAEEWNDFHQKSGIRDQGKREFSHREYGNKKHDKVTEERHLEGPSSKADQWRQHEYFESHKPNGSTRILRNEHALNEHKEDCSPDGTRRVYSHSSTVHVSSHMTTKHNSNIKTGEALTDFASFESPLPLDHSPQKGKGNLGKQGALNQRRRPSKGSLKVNVSSEDDFTDNNENEFSSNVRETLSSEVQRQNVENSRRSHYVNHQSSHVTSSSTSKSKNSSKSSAPQKSPEWLKELKERNTKRSQTSSPVTVHPSSRIDGIERNIKHSETSSYRKSAGSRDNNTVLVVNSGTWTKAKKSDRPARDHDPLTSKKERRGSNVKVTPNKEVHFGDSDGEDGQIASHAFDRQGKFSHLEESVATTFAANNKSNNTSVTLTTDQNSNQPKRNQHPGRNPRDASPSLQEKKQTKPISKPKSQSSPNSVILVEGPTTKLVTSFSYQTKTTKTTNQGTTSNQYQQQFGTYDKKELSQNSSSGFITINGDHPPTYATKNQHQPSGSSPRSTHQLDKTNVEVTKREVSSRREAIHLQEPPSQHKKASVEKLSEFGDNRAIIMNEIRKFDPRNLRKQRDSTKVGTTTSWLEGRYASYDRARSSNTNIVTEEIDTEQESVMRKGKNHSTKIHLSPDQKKPDNIYPNRSPRMSPEREHRSSNPTEVRIDPSRELRPFERTQSLPAIGVTKKKLEMEEERWEAYEENYEDDLEEELNGELFYESEGDDIEEESWVIRRNIDWENLERRQVNENGRQSPPWKSQVRLQPTPSNDPRDWDNESFRIENVQLRSTSPSSDIKDYPSFYFPEVDLRKTPPPHKRPPASFILPEVELRRTPSLPLFEPEHFSLSHVELRRTPSLPRLEPESFQLPEISLRRTPSVSRADSSSFTVPHVNLRRTPSLPRLEPDSFELPQVTLRRTPSLPRLEPTSFELPEVYLRRTPSLPRLEPESFTLPPVRLRRTPSLPRMDIEHVMLPEFELRRTPSCPRLEPESFQIPNVSLRRTPSVSHLPSNSVSFPEVQLRRTPSLPRLESESFWFPSVELRQTSINPRTDSDYFRLPEVKLNPVPFPPRTPEIDHFTLPAVELHRTNLWVSRSTEDDDRYGYSQSDMVFDDDRDSGGWSPRVLSPSAYRASSPRAISPDIHRTYSEPLLQPPWVQVANERQMKFYDWESIEERRNRESYSEAPWQEESIRKSESIRNLMSDYSKDNKDGEINNGVMSLDRHFGKIDSQESVNSWEWVETRDKTKPRPEWVEIAKQRQRMRNEMQEIDETISKHSSALTAPSWRTEIKLRETPGIPVLDSSPSPSPDGYKNEHRPKARPQAKPFPIDTFQTPVKAEWLKNVRLKKTSHLTKVKGPEVGRVLDDDERQTKVQPSSGIESKYNYFSSPTKSVSETGRVSPISRHTSKRRNQSEITVDHVLSSIRLIRQASLSTSDLSDLKNKSQVSPFLPPSKAESMYLTSSPTPQFYPRTGSPSADYGEPKTSTESEKPVFHPTPQWILDLKLRKQQRRVQPLNSRNNEERDVDSEIPQYDAADYRNTPSSKKSSTWSASTSRRQFRNVLNEIKNIGHEETPENTQRTSNYGSPRLHSVDRQDRPLITKEEEIYHQHKLEMLVSRDNRSPSPTQRSVSPTLSSKDNDESGVCNEPLTWWIQIPSSSKQPDSKHQQKKFQTFLNKKSSSPSQFSTRTRQSTTIQKHIPENTKRQNLSPLGKRSPSPSGSKFTSRTKEQSGMVTSRKVTQTIDKKSSAASSPVGRSPSASPTRRSPSTSARGRSPISTSRGRSPQASPTGRSPQASPSGRPPQASPTGRSPQASPSGRPPQTSSSGPSSPTAGGQVPSKVKASPQRGAAKPKTTSPKSTAKSPTTPKRTPVNSSPTSPLTKTEITVGVSRNSNVSVETNKFTPSNARSPSPDLTKKWNASPKSFVTTPKSSVNRVQSNAIDRNRMASKSTTAVSQSTSIQITSTHSTVVNSQKSSPTSSTPSPPLGKEFMLSSSSPPATRGRFSQLLSDLSKTDIQRSHSLKGDDSYSASISRDKHTFPLRFQESSSSFLDSAELVRQVSSSSRSLNIRKPRVRFSSTEIVWPLDLEGHSPVTTCHHPVQATD